jgi:hypothetical protein
VSWICRRNPSPVLSRVQRLQAKEGPTLGDFFLTHGVVKKDLEAGYKEETKIPELEVLGRRNSSKDMVYVCS